MSAKKLPWFRMYCDFLEDPKILSLAFEDQRHFIGVLALKSSGVLDQTCSEKMMNRIVAQKLWISHDAVDDVKRRLCEAGLIDEDWQPLAWDKRQFVSDRDPTGAERQRRYREKTRNALRDAPVTPPDTDTDTEQDTEEQKQDASEAQAPAPAATGKHKAGRIAFDLPTASWSGVSDMKRRLWAEAYPAVDLHVELAKAAAWLVANPANRKSNYDAFLNRWFARAQDSAPPVRPSGSPQVKPAAVNRLPKSYGESGRL